MVRGHVQSNRQQKKPKSQKASSGSDGRCSEKCPPRWTEPGRLTGGLRSGAEPGLGRRARRAAGSLLLGPGTSPQTRYFPAGH